MGLYMLILEGNPWMVFCHEWVQIVDGEIHALPLSKDLKEAAGKPHFFFQGLGSSWAKSL